MRTLTEAAGADVIKLIDGVPWAEVVDIALPDYFIPTETEEKFVAIAENGSKHLLITNASQMVCIQADGWYSYPARELESGWKVFYNVPYERDNIEDVNSESGIVKTKISLGDTGGVIESIMNRTGGMVGLDVVIGFAMHDNVTTVPEDLAGGMICFEPDTKYDLQVGDSAHDRTNFSITLSFDNPLEWKYPPRTMLKNVCHFVFGGLECGYRGIISSLVIPARGASVMDKKIFGGGWAISGGYIEKLDMSDGSIRTIKSILSSNKYGFIVGAGDNRFYAKRSDNEYLEVYGASAPGSYQGINGVTALKFPAYAAYLQEHRLSSGAPNEAYAITNTEATRYLYKLAGASYARVGTEQYYNIVSSAASGVAFAIQGGTEAIGTFTPSDLSTGRLIRVDGTTVTVLDQVKTWRWVLAKDATTCWMIDASDDFYYWDGAEYKEILLNPITAMILEGVQTKYDFSCAGGIAFLRQKLDDPYGGDPTYSLMAIDGREATPIDNAKTWLRVMAFDATRAWGYAQDGIYLVTKDGITFWDEDIKGDVTDLLPINGTTKAYYVANNQIYYTEKQNHKFCNQTMADCKIRHNQERFGGYPGIGSGGLAQ